MIERTSIDKDFYLLEFSTSLTFLGLLDSSVTVFCFFLRRREGGGGETFITLFSRISFLFSDCFSKVILRINALFLLLRLITMH